MIILKIAWRNILRNKTRTLLTVSMMAFGYILSSFFISLADGAYSNIIKQFINAQTGEIQLHSGDYLENPKLYKTIDHYQRLIEKVEKIKDVEGVAPRIQGGALAFHENKTIGSKIWGVDFKKETHLTTLGKRINSGRIPSAEGEVVIGKKIAKILNLNLEDEIILISSGADGSIANDKFKIVGMILPEQTSQDDYMVYMSLASAQEFFSMWGRVHTLMVRTTADLLAFKKIKLGHNITISTWKDVEQDFYKAMLADKKGDAIGRYIIMFVVAIGVLNTILMSILERKKEFGILKAIGTKPSQLFQLIMLETLLIGAISIIIGAILAFALNTYFAHYGISFEKPIEYGGMVFDKMVCIINFEVFIFPMWAVLITAIGVSLYPAYKAAKTVPVEAMR